MTTDKTIRNLDRGFVQINFGLTGIFLLSLFLSLSFVVNSQNLKMKEADAWKYMHMLSADEMNRRDEIGKSFLATDPPSSPVESLAEFEPMAGVIIKADAGIPESLLVALGKIDTLYVLVANDIYPATLLKRYSDWGVPPEHCKFILAKTDSHWTRDYGPMFTAGNDSIGITDFVYNRPRPLDNKVPQIIASAYGFPYYGMDLVHTGGNYMSDGYGIAASTQIVYSENSVSPEEVNQNMKDYLGIHTYHVVDDPNETSINHIDCWGKFLDVDKILIRSVPESNPQYTAIEEAASYFKNQKSSWGNNYQVFRVYTPNDEPYTNSFILNKRVFVPLMGSEWDNEALKSYEEAMPGYYVMGFEYPHIYESTTASYWYSTDALHCRVHEMADKQMVRIKHIPIRGAQGDKTDFTVDASIKAYSRKPLNNDSVLVYYKVDFGEWQLSRMEHIEGDTYSVQLPEFNKDQVIQYYIYAADQVGKRATLPVVGAAAPFAFATSDVFTNTDPEPVLNEIKVYPNPVCDQLNISINNILSREIVVDLYNNSGQRIKTMQFDPYLLKNIKVDFSALSSGFYFVKISSDEVYKTFKIIKK